MMEMYNGKYWQLDAEEHPNGLDDFIRETAKQENRVLLCL